MGGGGEGESMMSMNLERSPPNCNRGRRRVPCVIYIWCDTDVIFPWLKSDRQMRK